MERFDVLGIGNAIVDILAHTDNQFLIDNQIIKGSMSLIDTERATYLYPLMQTRQMISGGSAANTIAGIAHMAGRSAFIGKVGDDALGTIFRSDMHNLGVHFQTPPTTCGTATAQSLIFITPDADRTMNTFLGASVHLSPQDIDVDLIQTSKIIYLEGYLYDHPFAEQAFIKAAHTAHQTDSKIALSLSDLSCVDRHRAELRSFVVHHTDLLFANEGELMGLYQRRCLSEALVDLQQCCSLAAITRGAEGIFVVTPQSITEIPAEYVSELVDTTGAGDQFAAGFLYGFTHGCSLETCARWGAISAAEVITHEGARLQTRLAFAECTTITDKLTIS